MPDSPALPNLRQRLSDTLRAHGYRGALGEDTDEQEAIYPSLPSLSSRAASVVSHQAGDAYYDEYTFYENPRPHPSNPDVPNSSEHENRDAAAIARNALIFYFKNPHRPCPWSSSTSPHVLAALSALVDEDLTALSSLVGHVIDNIERVQAVEGRWRNEAKVLSGMLDQEQRRRLEDSRTTKAQLVTVQKELEQYKELGNSLRVQLATTQKDLEQQHCTVRDLQTQLQRLKCREQERDSQRETIQDLQAELQRLSSVHGEQNELQERLSNVERERDGYLDTIRELRTQSQLLNGVKSACTELPEQLKHLCEIEHDDHASTIQDLQTQLQRFNDVENARNHLQNQLNGYVQTNQDLQGQLQAIKDEHNSLRNQRDGNLRTQLEQIQGVAGARKAELVAAQAEIESHLSTITRLRYEHSTARLKSQNQHSSAITKVEDERNNLQTQLSNSTATIFELRVQVERVERDRDCNLENIHKLQSQLWDIEKEHNNLEGQFKIVKEERDVAEKALGKEEAKHTADVNDCNKEKVMLTSKLQTARGECQQKQAVVDSLTAQLQRQIKDQKGIQGERDRAMQQFNTASENVTTTTTRLSSMTQRIRNLETQLKEAQVQAVTNAQDLGFAQATKTELQRSLAAEQTANAQLGTDLNSANHQTNAVTKALSLYKGKLSVKDTELRTLQQHLKVLVPLVQRMLEYVPALWESNAQLFMERDPALISPASRTLQESLDARFRKLGSILRFLWKEHSQGDKGQGQLPVSFFGPDFDLALVLAAFLTPSVGIGADAQKATESWIIRAWLHYPGVFSGEQEPRNEMMLCDSSGLV